jgi:hypothetical protein
MTLFLLVITAIGRYKVFQKAKVTPWLAFVPLISSWYLIKIAKISELFFVALISPFVFYSFYILSSIYIFKTYTIESFEYQIRLWGTTPHLLFLTGGVIFFLLFLIASTYAVIYIYLAKAFGKGSIYSLGLIFLPFIFFPLLGFGNAGYLFQKNT